MAASALSQGVGLATGLQKSFSWTDVATAGIEAAGTTAILQAINQDDTVEDVTVTGTKQSLDSLGLPDSGSVNPTDPSVVAARRSTATQILNAEAAGYTDAQIASNLSQGNTFINGTWYQPPASGSGDYVPVSSQPAGTNGGSTDGQGGSVQTVTNGYGNAVPSANVAAPDISTGVPDSADDQFSGDLRLFPAGTTVAPQLLQFPDGSLYYNVAGQLYSYSWAAQSYLEATGQAPSYVAAGMDGDSSTADTETGLHLADYALGGLLGVQSYRNGLYVFRGQEYPLDGRAISQNMRLAQLDQAFKGSVGEAAARSFFGLSVIANGAEAYDEGFSPRADTKAAVGTALAYTALVQPEVGIPLALAYSVADHFGVVDDFLYGWIPDKPLLQTGKYAPSPPNTPASQ
jgi:hypothetical protein